MRKLLVIIVAAMFVAAFVLASSAGATTARVALTGHDAQTAVNHYVRKRCGNLSYVCYNRPLVNPVHYTGVNKIGHAQYTFLGGVVEYLKPTFLWLTRFGWDRERRCWVAGGVDPYGRIVKGRKFGCRGS